MYTASQQTPTSAAPTDTFLVSYSDTPASLPVSDSTSPIELELVDYLQESPININASTYEYWKSKQERYPLLCSMAKKYLSPPPSSVASEQFFSVASDLYANKKRNRLKLKKANKLLFLNKALPAINYRYKMRDTLDNVPEISMIVSASDSDE